MNTQLTFTPNERESKILHLGSLLHQMQILEEQFKTLNHERHALVTELAQEIPQSEPAKDPVNE